MRLEFVPVEEFYFALTLAVRTLTDLDQPGLASRVGERLAGLLGEPSTVASARQNTYNYVFRVRDYDHAPAPQLVVSLADWQGKLRLSSDYGWMLDGERKPVRTSQFELRPQFCSHLQAHLTDWLQIPLIL